LAEAGEAIGFTLKEQIYVQRGEIATRADETPPKVTQRLRVSLFWLGKQPMLQKETVYFEIRHRPGKSTNRKNKPGY
jgi:bifunctional enzyme CysN/CysC